MRAAVVLLLALSGCSSEDADDCARALSDCPNEPSLVAECRVEATTCPATARALLLCVAGHQVCDARGKLDRAASQALCPDLRLADERCRAGGSDAGVDAAVATDSGVNDAGLETGADAASASMDAKLDAKPD